MQKLLSGTLASGGSAAPVQACGLHNREPLVRKAAVFRCGFGIMVVRGGSFDDGEDVTDAFDWENARRPNLEPRRVNVDFPAWMVAALDREATRLGVTRQALIKLWIADRLGKAA